MRAGSWGIVMLRALATGVVMGASSGGLVAEFFAVESPGGSSPLLSFLLISVIGVVIGALTGLACAIPAGLILAAARRFLHRHVRLVRVFGGMVVGALFASILAAAVRGPWDEGWFIAEAKVFGIGFGLGAFNTKFVVTGKPCRVGRCLARRMFA